MEQNENITINFWACGNEFGNSLSRNKLMQQQMKNLKGGNGNCMRQRLKPVNAFEIDMKSTLSNRKITTIPSLYRFDSYSFNCTTFRVASIEYTDPFEKK